MDSTVEAKRKYYFECERAIMPAFIRDDKSLGGGAKLLYALLTLDIDEEGYCYLHAREFAKKWNLSHSTVNRTLRILEKKGYIEIGDKNIVEHLKAKNLHGLGYGDKVCEWCGVKTTVLEEHHYPIPRADGGKEVVHICPTCHREFHNNYSLIRLVLPKSELQQILALRGSETIWIS